MRRSWVGVLAVAALAAVVYQRRDRGQMKLAADLSGKRCLVMGGTKGIGLGLAKNFAARGARVTVVGRSAGTAVAELDELTGSPGASGFVAADLSQVAASEAVVRSYLESSGGALDVLVLSPGIATVQGYTPTPEGIDVKMALHYYARVAAALAAAPALAASGGSCLFVLSAGVHSAYLPEQGQDWALTADSFSLKRAADAAGFYTDAAVASLAALFPAVRWVHAAPGFVASSWGTEMPLPLRWLVRGAQLFATSPAACAERLAAALLVPQQPGAFLCDSGGRIIAPMEQMTEQTRAAIWQHTTNTIAAAKK